MKFSATAHNKSGSSSVSMCLMQALRKLKIFTILRQRKPNSWQYTCSTTWEEKFMRIKPESRGDNKYKALQSLQQSMELCNKTSITSVGKQKNTEPTTSHNVLCIFCLSIWQPYHRRDLGRLFLKGLSLWGWGWGGELQSCGEWQSYNPIRNAQATILA